LSAFGIDVAILVAWLDRSMGALNAVRPAIYALTLMVLGLQFVFAAFFLTLFQVRTHAMPTNGPGRSTLAPSGGPGKQPMTSLQAD